ncbi:KPN_02809 family neutral zinc metallopeptidase [Microbacterium marinilacus]|uniref:Neutral zinc metallopeptidase n=1 Tax=Microbacterium marinilacus TaxID=415209 RepID=A0ABP7BJE1_9MICO|nr:neutral zinc metallopeptidase [Microbacterium marinilacus]MBY0689523.1 neutral zinc metallopeptidase [Microbacterium marinilacus]
MTFNENAKVGGNKARRRGRTTAIATGGGIGVLGIAVLLISAFTGQDLGGLLGVLGGGESSQQQPAEGGTAISDCETGQDANENDDCRLAAGSLAIDQFWAESVDGYREPQLIIVEESTSSRCGTASNATGPFYCPPEETVYVAPTFFGLLRSQYGATAGSLAQLYVLAHEYGHHVQNLLGVFEDHPTGDTGPDSNGVRIELQADCFAGAWVAGMADQVDEDGNPYLESPTREQIADALNAAAAVGDDHIQEQATGTVTPESWTHGSSEQRQRWFEAGREGGPNACDTFAVSAGDL